MIKPALSARAMGYAQADKRIEILQLVGQHGSISEAARVGKVSYKAAWQAIHTLTNLAGEPLVDRRVGGAGGGGARLTLAGERLLAAAEQLDTARRGVLARVNGAESAALASPRTSMRNHLLATVSALRSDGARDPMVRAVLALAGGGELASLITRESAELLGLTPGLAVLALCKATAVRIEPVGASTPVDSNLLPGRVLRAARGHARDEMVLTLPGGQQLTGFAARPNRLRAGSAACACVDDSAVVVALG
ncbi:TOBE domain-containing protein [Ottowia testudinis]|uniref:LysR family transcriptional regulator n=1 Tax=Ottowia testudinis TaxID=2816950 RepID=A0A975H282_9BURK|nr:TOBE domain-containing protein [Ottowia testudinis]QTD44524.1 LysR family transcriptional regulator [Ottowia testudinis]